MKAKYFFLVAMCFCSVTLFAQAKTDTVKVWGVCEECKGKIESAAKKGGAVSADWDMDNYKLVINYDANKTSALDIEKSIAAVGYDTHDVRADDAVYKKLPSCCQYERETTPGTNNK